MQNKNRKGAAPITFQTKGTAFNKRRQAVTTAIDGNVRKQTLASRHLNERSLEGNAPHIRIDDPATSVASQ